MLQTSQQNFYRKWESINQLFEVLRQTWSLLYNTLLLWSETWTLKKQDKSRFSHTYEDKNLKENAEYTISDNNIHKDIFQNL